jgi:hypothetical protein
LNQNDKLSQSRAAVIRLQRRGYAAVLLRDIPTIDRMNTAGNKRSGVTEQIGNQLCNFFPRRKPFHWVDIAIRSVTSLPDSKILGVAT